MVRIVSIAQVVSKCIKGVQDDHMETLLSRHWTPNDWDNRNRLDRTEAQTTPVFYVMVKIIPRKWRRSSQYGRLYENHAKYSRVPPPHPTKKRDHNY